MSDPSNQTEIERLCLFAHYDVDGIIADHVRIYLHALGAYGFKIVVISTARLDRASLSDLSPHVVGVIVRENIGLDFGSWARGFNDWAHRCTGEILLANDSVYAPIGDLSSIVSALGNHQADVRGMVLSREFKPHLQSWFLLIRKHVWQHPDFRDFLNQPFGDLTKTEIIMRGEVGFADFIARHGFSFHAAFPSRDTLPLRIAANPTHFLWQEIVCDAGLPFIKVELLRDNPMKLANVREWRRIVAERAPAMLKPLDHHLGRVGKDCSVRKGAGNRFAEFVRRDYRYARERNHLAQQLNLARYKLILLGYRMIWCAALIRKRVKPIPVIGPAAEATWSLAKRMRKP